MNSKKVVVTDAEVLNALKNQKHEEERKLNFEVTKSSLGALIRVLNRMNPATVQELVENETSLSRSDIYYFDQLHELWRTSINFYLYFTNQPMLEEKDFLKPISKRHIGYLFHSHYYPPNKDSKREELNYQRNFRRTKRKLEKWAQERLSGETPFP